MADGSVVFATELDDSGLRTALLNLGKENFGLSPIVVPVTPDFSDVKASASKLILDAVPVSVEADEEETAKSVRNATTSAQFSAVPVKVPLAADDKDFLESIDKLGYKIGSLIGSGIEVAIAGIGVVGGGAVALVKNSLDSIKELEQNIGGSEAVFADYAKTIQGTGQKAFKQLGLSQSDYLATANQMGSLFKGLGYDAEESAEITMDAMQRAADVASIMGIDTAWAMESIAGAAKGNFTMMDNLGVAINDTTLANYALEKGIEKSVSKMTTQEKTGLALEMFMEKTAYATGQYAKENDTLAGSLTTLGAAWDNFLAGTGETSVDDLVWSLTNAADVMVAKLQELMPRLQEELPALIEKLTPVLSELLTTVMPSLTKMIVAIIPPVASALGEAAKALAPALFEGLLAGLIGDAGAAKVMAFFQKLFNPEQATGMAVEQTAGDAAIQNAALQETDFLAQQYELQREQMAQMFAETPVQVPVELTPTGEEAAGDGGFFGWLSGVLGKNENVEQSKAAGRKIVSDMGAGMEEAAAEVETKAGELGTRVKKAFIGAGRTRPDQGVTGGEAGEGGEGEGGESNPLAQSIIADVLAGLTAGSATVTQGVQTVINTAQTSANTSGFNSVGLQITAGMAAGVRSGSGLLVAAVRSVIEQALAAAQEAAQIQSPSRLFRDEVGAMISAGTAVGIENDAYRVRKAVNAMVLDSVPDMRRVSARAASLLASYSDSGVLNSARAASVASVNQTNNFNVPYATPDVVADTMLQYATYGLAAEG